MIRVGLVDMRSGPAGSLRVDAVPRVGDTLRLGTWRAGAYEDDGSTRVHEGGFDDCRRYVVRAVEWTGEKEGRFAPPDAHATLFVEELGGETFPR